MNQLKLRSRSMLLQVTRATDNERPEVLKETIPEIKLFLHSFLHTIEHTIFKYGNDDLWTLIYTKEKDDEFIFKSIVKI